MTLSEIRAQREVILGIASRHGARNVRLFGSVARGTSGSGSDVDLLVDLEPGRTLLDLGGLLMEMQISIGVRVDVALDRMLRPDVRDQALSEAIPL
jgi:predicted nucleotidyltransferase